MVVMLAQTLPDQPKARSIARRATNALVLVARVPIIAAAPGSVISARIGIEERRWEQGFMSDEHQAAVDETEVASTTSSESDSAADMKAILVVFPAAVAFCVFYISGWSFDL